MTVETIFPRDLPEDPSLTYAPPLPDSDADGAGAAAAGGVDSSESPLAPLSISRWSLGPPENGEREDPEDDSQDATAAPRRGPIIQFTSGLSPRSESQVETGDLPDGVSSAESAAEELPAGPAYRLSKRVGRGGMGEVWEARQLSLGRRVAIKKIRADFYRSTADDSAARGRAERDFRLEASATARLEHPNIVPVHDLGADAHGAPLLAMKLVRGEPWDKSLRKDFDALPVDEFLGRHLPILVDVAQAVAFAHSKGIVHRDLKPAQVMTGEFGETLLMDWGLAIQAPIPGAEDSLNREANDPDAARLPTPETASNPAGTPALMAPEQTEPHAAGIGAWTDIYLLGGTLYFLLAGAYPHSAPTSIAAMEKARRGEVEPPSLRAPKRPIPPELEELCVQALAKRPADRVPSAKAFVAALNDYLSGATKRRESEELASAAKEEFYELAAQRGKAAAEIYARRGSVAEKLARALALWPGNDEARRFSARNLAERSQSAIDHGDLVLARVHLEALEKASLDDDSVDRRSLAARLDAAERRRARARKQRLALAAATLLLLAASIMFGVRSERARLKAERAEKASNDTARESLQLVSYLVNDLFNSLRADDERDLALIRQISGKLVEHYNQVNLDDAPTQTRVRHAEGLRVVGAFLAKFGSPKAGAEFARRSVEVMEQEGIPDRDGRMIQALNTLAWARWTLDNSDAEAVKLFERTLEAQLDDEARNPVQTAAALINLAVQRGGGGSVDGQALIDQAVEMAAGIRRQASRVEATGVHLRAQGERARGEPAKARLSYELALETLQKGGPLDEQEEYAANMLAGLGDALVDLGDAQGALAPLRRALAIQSRRLPPEHPERLALVDKVADALLELGKPEEAAKLVEEWVALSEDRPGLDRLRLATQLATLARASRESGRYVEAEAAARRALAIQEELLSPDDPRLAQSLYNLAQALWKLGRDDESMAVYERALALSRLPGADPSYLCHVATDLGRFLSERGEEEEALALLEEAVASLEKWTGATRRQRAEPKALLAEALSEAGRSEESRKLFHSILDEWRAELNPSPSLEVASALRSEGRAAAAAGDVEEARRLLEQSIAMIEEVAPGRDVFLRTNVNQDLGYVYWRLRDYASAASAYESAIADYERHGRSDHFQMVFLQANLGQNYVDLGRFRDAAAAAERALALWDERGRPRGAARSAAQAATVLCSALDDAAPLSEEADAARHRAARMADENAGRFGDDWYHADAATHWWRLAKSRVQRGMAAESVEAARRALEVAAERREAAPGDGAWLRRWARSALLLADALGLSPEGGEKAAALRTDVAETLRPMLRGARDPSIPAAYAEAALRLGRTSEAISLGRQLRSAGFNDPTFAEFWRDLDVAVAAAEKEASDEGGDGQKEPPESANE